MEQKKPNPFGWFAHGPLGPWGRKLGFRWVFPIGTLPVPFHPLFFPLAMLGLVGWTIWRAVALVSGALGGGDWLVLLGLALALGLGLSVPILAWVLVALGGRILQAGLFLCSMVLLAIACWSGSAPVWLGVVPALFIAVWLFQAVGGRILRRQLVAEWDAFEPVNLGGRPLALNNNSAWGTPTDMLHSNALAEIWRGGYSNESSDHGYFRLAPGAAAQLQAIAGEVMPTGWNLTDHDGVFLLDLEGTVPPGTVRLTSEDWKAPLGMLAKGVRQITLDDGTPRTVRCGAISMILPLPLFELFRWTSITGPHQRRIGFAYGKPLRTGPTYNSFSGLLVLPDLIARKRKPQKEGMPFGSTLPFEPVIGVARMDELVALLSAAVTSRQQAIATLRAGLALDPVPTKEIYNTLSMLQRKGTAPLGPDAGAFALDWLERARDARKQDGVRAAAWLINSLPDDEFAALAPALHQVLNSRKLALEWKLVPGFDPTPLPKETPRFGNVGGFGLVFKVPKLWIRLGKVHPESRVLIEKLAEEMPLPRGVMNALAGWKTEPEA